MDKRLSQDEMNALLGRNGPAKGKSAAGGNGSPMAYDFRRPDRLSKGMMDSLRQIHEKLALGIATGISGRLRVMAELNLRSIEQMTCADFISTLPEVTYLAAVEIRPMAATAAIQCNSELAFNLIDRMTGGGGGASDSSARKMTEIERNILDDIVNAWTRNLEEAWSVVTEFHFRVSASDTSPQGLRIADSDQIMVVAAFDLKVEQLESTIQMCVPFSVLEPIKSKLEKDSNPEAFAPRSNSPKAFRRILRAPLQLTAELPTTKIPLRELNGISANDVVMLDVKIQDAIEMSVAGRRSFNASLVQAGGQKSVRLIFHQEGSRK